MFEQQREKTMDIIKSNGLHFAIYIGKGYFCGQGDNIFAVVKAEKGEYIPHGVLNLDGTHRDGWAECFESVKQVGDFIADWIDILGKPCNITATVYLGKQSIHKSFKGKKIVDVLDRIAKIRDMRCIQHFDDIFEGVES